jgi:hypothetical protein
MMKNKKRKKTKAKSKENVNCIDLIIVLYQPAVTYVYIGSMTQLFESGIRNFFLSKLNLKT